MFANNNNSSVDKGIIRSLNNDIIILLISLAVMMAIGKYLFKTCVPTIFKEWFMAFKIFCFNLGFVSAVVLNYMTELRIQRAQSRKGLKKFVEEIHKSTQKMPGQ